MKQYLQNWNFLRLLRLAMGVAIIVQGINLKEYAISIIGAWFTIMAIANMGCCGVGSCNTNYYNKKNNTEKETSYEEIVEQ